MIQGDASRGERDINPAIPVVTVETQMSGIEEIFFQEGSGAGLGAFRRHGGVVGVAAIGLFGLVSFDVVAADAGKSAFASQ